MGTFSEQPFFAPFEVLKESSIDTLRAKSHYLFTKKYALIPFDSGAYWLPPQKVMVDGFSKISDSLLIQVATVTVDTLKQKLFDIKPVAEVEQNFDNLFRSIIYGLLLVLLLVGLIYAFFLCQKKKRRTQEKITPLRTCLRGTKSFGNHYSIFTRGIQTLLL